MKQPIKNIIGKCKTVILWIIAVFIVICSLVFIPSVSSVLLLLLAFIVVPIRPIQNLIKKIRIGTALKIVLSVVLFIVSMCIAPGVKDANRDIAQETTGENYYLQSTTTNPETTSGTEDETTAPKDEVTEATEISTEPETTEPETEPETEAATEPPKTTDPTTHPNNETTQPKQTEPPTNPPPTTTTAPPTEPPTEPPTTPPTEPPTEPSTEPTNGDPYYGIINPDAPYVGSVNSKVYHLSSCHLAANIKESNRVWFDSADDAIAAGRHGCKECIG